MILIWKYLIYCLLSYQCDMVCSANRVQEIMDDDQRESGRIPRTVECELTADLGTMTTSLDLNAVMYMYNCEIVPMYV